jgi:TIR domain-containing protein
MRAVFISYRREDSEGQAGRLFDDLVQRFGEDSVFMDVAGIEPGRDFRRVIDQHVAECGVLLAVIGKDWLDAKDESGRQRLEDPMDFVRLETASALKRDIPVIPVLVRGAVMPRSEQLPPDLAELAFRNGVELTHARWDSDIEVLVKALRRHVEGSPEKLTTSTSEQAESMQTTTGAGIEFRPSDESGADSPSRRGTASSSRRPLRFIIGMLAAVVAITLAGYLVYQKVAEDLRRSVVTEAEKLAEQNRNANVAEQAKKLDQDSNTGPPGVAQQTNKTGQNGNANTAEAAEQTRKTDQNRKTETEKGDAGSAGRAPVSDKGKGSAVKEADTPKTTLPTLPSSYTLAGTWEDDRGVVFATVADPKRRGVFEMEQIKPPKKADSLWQATLKGRTVEIAVVRLPSHTLVRRMNLELSLDGNRMAGLAQVNAVGPDDQPAEPTPIHFRRIN